jgi:hydroxypyruvate reductase
MVSQIFIGWLESKRMIHNRDRLARDESHALALDCIEDGIEAAAPETAVRSAVELDGDTLFILDSDYDLSQYEDVIVVGGGKAVGGVTQALESTLGNRISDGIVVSKQSVDTTTVRVAVGDHPLPSQRNVDATGDLLSLVDDAGETTLILFIMTGGASALLSSPAADLSIDDLEATTRLLLESGVDIAEINAVRKHLSSLKGGQVARRASPATTVGILLSDVVGNDISTIGSGVTVPDPTSFDDALAVFDRYDIDPPDAVRRHLEAGANGTIPETPFPVDPAFDSVTNHLVGDNLTTLDAARSTAEDAGYQTLLLSSRLRGESSEIAKPLVAVAEEIAATGNPIEKPAVVLAGGETTVTVRDTGGDGGPNQELVLSGALEIEGPEVLAAVDTDGEDGSSDAAGAIANSATVTDVGSARSHLHSNDAGTYLKAANAKIETGPTGTNVNDMIVLVVPDGS